MSEIEIVSDTKISWYNPTTNIVEHGCRSHQTYDNRLEEHLVKLSNGTSVHVTMPIGKIPTMEDVINALIFKANESERSSYGDHPMGGFHDD